MSDLNIHHTQMIGRDGTPIRLSYDQDGDVLDVYFGDNVPAIGIPLTEDIILRLDEAGERPISLILNNISALTEQTEFGPRSFPLEQLDELPRALRQLVVRVVTSAPVNQFLKLSHLQASPTKRVPITVVSAAPVAV